MGSGEASHTVPAGTTQPAVDLDVIVATRNRPDDLRRLVDSLAQVHTGDVELTVYVIDQSDEEHIQANRQACGRLSCVQHVVQHERGKSRALNHALKISHSDVIAFTDDDCTLPADWPSPALRVLHEQPDVGIVFGRVLPVEHDPEVVFIPAIDFPDSTTVTGPTKRSHGLLGMGANMVIRRAVLEEIGGFDEDLGPGGQLFTGEECELALRALQHGHSIRQDRGLALDHWGARPLAGDIARQLVLTSFYAIGAGYGKHIRQREWRVVFVLVHEVWRNLAEIGGNVAARRRPLHAKRLLHLLRGTVAGLRAGPAAPPLERR